MSYSTTPAAPAETGLARTCWLICIIGAVGFAFDIYALLMLPQLIKSATAGGVFRLPGGFLTDLFGRSRVLTDSIPLCTFSSLVSAVLTQFLPETKLESLTD